jgi:hypothetical protein
VLEAAGENEALRPEVVRLKPRKNRLAVVGSAVRMPPADEGPLQRNVSVAIITP